jgi:hypothetical protein
MQVHLQRLHQFWFASSLIHQISSNHVVKFSLVVVIIFLQVRSDAFPNVNYRLNASGFARFDLDCHLNEHLMKYDAYSFSNLLQAFHKPMHYSCPADA